MDESFNSGSVSLTSESPLDVIKKLKELLDLGAITQEEFDSKKEKIMGEI